MAKKKNSKAHDDLWQYVLSCRQLEGLKFNFQQKVGKFEADFICKEKNLIIQISDEALNSKMQKAFEKANYWVLVLKPTDISGDFEGCKNKIVTAIESK